MRQPIHSDNAPAAIGPYSQAIRAGNTVYLSGQTPMDPKTGQVVEGDIAVQARRALDNLKAVCEAAGGSFDRVVRIGLYLTDLGNFAAVNAVMAEYFTKPYPARSTIEVAGLPKGADFEIVAVMVFDCRCRAWPGARRRSPRPVNSRCPRSRALGRAWRKSLLRAAC
jgi:reactive intermediate/imine deaminase